MRPTILVAEDDEDDAFIMERAFTETGLAMKLHIVQNGDEAVDYLSGSGAFSDRTAFPLPILTILDLKMPGRNGFEVLEWKRSHPELRMPFVILSSSPEDRDMRRARELGASAYLIKPPSKTLLLGCLKQLGLIPKE